MICFSNDKSKEQKKKEGIKVPTRLRVDLAGYHHIINRGVNRCDIFNNDEDNKMFLQIFDILYYIRYNTYRLKYIKEKIC